MGTTYPQDDERIIRLAVRAAQDLSESVHNVGAEDANLVGKGLANLLIQNGDPAGVPAARVRDVYPRAFGIAYRVQDKGQPGIWLLCGCRTNWNRVQLPVRPGQRAQCLDHGDTYIVEH